MALCHSQMSCAVLKKRATALLSGRSRLGHNHTPAAQLGRGRGGWRLLRRLRPFWRHLGAAQGRLGQFWRQIGATRGQLGGGSGSLGRLGGSFGSGTGGYGR